MDRLKFNPLLIAFIPLISLNLWAKADHLEGLNTNPHHSLQSENQIARGPSPQDDPHLATFRPSLASPLWEASGSFLYWRTLQNHLDYAIKGQPLPPIDTATGPIGDYKSATFSWDIGFRAGLECRFSQNLWEFSALYTHFHNHGAQKIDAPSNASSELLVTTFTDLLGFRLNFAKSSLAINYNSADFCLGRSFALNEHLFLKLMGGLTGQWLSESWHLEYVPLFEDEESVSHCLKFSGAGLLCGLDVDWYLGAGLSLFSQIATATAIGSYSNQARIELGDEVYQNGRERELRALPQVRLMLGPRFGQKIQKVGVDLFVGYEMVAIANFSQINRSGFDAGVTTARLSEFSQGTLTFQGLSVALSLTY